MIETDGLSVLLVNNFYGDDEILIEKKNCGRNKTNISEVTAIQAKS